MKKLFSLAVLSALAISLSACDSSSTSAPDDNSSATVGSNTSSSAINWTEKPSTCQATQSGNTVTFTMVFKNWSVTEQNLFDGDIAHVTQTYTGTTDSDNEIFCVQTKSDEEATNIVCNGSVITHDDPTDGYTAATETALYNSFFCPALNDGSITLQDIFFEE